MPSRAGGNISDLRSGVLPRRRRPASNEIAQPGHGLRDRGPAAHGEPEQVRNDPRVLDAYLGGALDDDDIDDEGGDSDDAGETPIGAEGAAP